MTNLEGHICPRPLRATLPWKIQQDAISGRIQNVCGWLDGGGNINAADQLDRTLLHSACQGQQFQMVKKLLEYPDIHLNTRMTTKPCHTPLGIAAMNEDMETLQILLNAQPSKCLLSHSIPVENIDKSPTMTVLPLAAHMKKWGPVRLMLKYYTTMSEWEAFEVLSKAIGDYEYDIAMDIIQRDFPFRDRNFDTFLPGIYQNKNFGLVDAIFRKNIHNFNDSSMKFFYFLSTRKDWSNLETYLCLLNGEAKIHVAMVEAILAKKMEEVEKILKDVKGDPEVIAGTLLAATIIGTSEELAEMLLKYDSVQHSDQTLANALLLASQNNRKEFIEQLLLMKRFSLKILSRSHSVAHNSRDYATSDLLQKCLDERCKELSIVHKVVDNGDSSEEEEDSRDARKKK